MTTAALASLPALAATAEPDQELLSLWAEMVRAERTGFWAVDGEACEQMSNEQEARCARIAELPATTAKGMAVKIWVMALYGAKAHARRELADEPALMTPPQYLSLFRDAERLLPAPDLSRQFDYGHI